jgi:hypothetical protein
LTRWIGSCTKLQKGAIIGQSFAQACMNLHKHIRIRTIGQG